MLVYGCVLGCLPPVLTAAAAMSCKPMFHDPKDKSAATAAKRAASDDAGGRSDHLAAARAFERWRDAGGRRDRDPAAAGDRLCVENFDCPTLP